MSKGEWFWTWIAAILGVIGLIIWLWLYATPAFAHDFYTNTNDPVLGVGCCGGTDCKQIPESSVKLTPSGGYIYLPTGEFIPQSRVQQAPDWQYHRCEFQHDVNNPELRLFKKQGDTRCFFAPGGVG